jgi:ABC-type sugar transport system ATPase subunit
MNKLEAKNITFGFGKRILLQDVSLSLEAGERVALIGPSGCGKTTLLRILCGLLPAWKGSILLNGRTVEANTASIGFTQRSNIWPEITLVFQDFQLFPTMTAMENCCFGIDQIDVRNRAADYALALGVDYCLDRRPRQLSKGEQQRVSIIRALVRNPFFLLLDEPTAALDKDSRRLLHNLLLQESKSRNLTTLFVTHDLVFARDLGTRALMIDDQCLRNSNISSV